MAKSNPALCPKPTPAPPPSCIDTEAAKQCICKVCTCGKHGCTPAEVSKFQALNIKDKDARFQGNTEYVEKYDHKTSHADRISKDGITLRECYPTQGDRYSKPTNSEYTASYVDKPIFPAKARKEGPVDDYGPTFAARTTYDDAYLNWPADPRDAMRPPGFEPVDVGFQGTSMYTTHYCDRSRPVQPWRKSEHWPHNYNLCEVNHPRSSGPFKAAGERAAVVNFPNSNFKGDTTYSDYYKKWDVQESVRAVKPGRWGPSAEAFGGHTSYSDAFRGPSAGEKCPVMMRPKPTATVDGHQCYP